MKIDIRFRGLDSSGALRDHAERLVHLHLSRFGREIGSVAVRVSDVNGPKGGVDKQCRVTVRGRRFAAVVVDDASHDAYAAVDLAVSRTGRAVGRDLERARSLYR
jgi:ribosome-associated translation inhibitor RaiA